MKNLYFEDYEDLAYAISDSYISLKGDDFEDVAVVAKYEEARQVIKELIYFGYDIHSINIIDEEHGEYDAEYIISLYDDEIWCEPMLRESGYISDDSSVIYVLDNCSSKVIPYCKGKIVYEVSVGEIDECGRDKCECAYQKDEKPITTSKESYTIDGKPVTKEEFDKKNEELINTIKDILDFMDEVNGWRSKPFRW